MKNQKQTNKKKNFLYIFKKNKLIPFFLSSGLPFLTVAITMSPTPAAGNLLRRPLTVVTAIKYKFLAPVLSAQLTTAPTGKPRAIRKRPLPAPPATAK